MDKAAQIANFRSVIASKQANLHSYYEKDRMYQQQYNSELSKIRQLERELEDLLFYKKKAMKEFTYMEELITGDGSRMGRIQLVKPGRLEGRALELIQNRINSRKKSQQLTLAHINQSIQHMKQKSIEIEQELEAARRQILSLDQYIETNQLNIQRLKMDIATVQGQIRTLS